MKYFSISLIYGLLTIELMTSLVWWHYAHRKKVFFSLVWTTLIFFFWIWLSLRLSNSHIFFLNWRWLVIYILYRYYNGRNKSVLTSVTPPFLGFFLCFLEIPTISCFSCCILIFLSSNSSEIIWSVCIRSGSAFLFILTS